MTKVAILVVHGIGLHAVDDDVRRGLVTDLMDPVQGKAKLDKALARHVTPDRWTTALAYWGQEIEVPQRDYFERTKADLRWDDARRLVISALGDAAQYQASVFEDGERVTPAYGKIHAVVARALETLADQCGPDAPLVIVAHSLGAHIASNHIWDERQAAVGKRTSRGNTPLSRMQTLRGFATLGCNIPLFLLGARELAPIALGDATWDNYYDPDDILGYPLEPFYFPGGTPDDYALRDRKVEVGNFVPGRTPLSHGYYWDDRGVTRGIATMVERAAGLI
jgi:hypothetical protein